MMKIFPITLGVSFLLCCVECWRVFPIDPSPMYNTYDVSKDTTGIGIPNKYAFMRPTPTVKKTEEGQIRQTILVKDSIIRSTKDNDLTWSPAAKTVGAKTADSITITASPVFKAAGFPITPTAVPSKELLPPKID